MFGFGSDRPYFGLTGTWLTVWVTVACATDMVSLIHHPQMTRLTIAQTLFGYDQGVFGTFSKSLGWSCILPWRRWCRRNPRLSQPAESEQQPVTHQYGHSYLRHWMFSRCNLSLRHRRPTRAEEVRAPGYDHHEHRRYHPDCLIRRTRDDRWKVNLSRLLLWPQ